MPELSYEDISEIIQLIKELDAVEVSLEYGDFRIHISRNFAGNLTGTIPEYRQSEQAPEPHSIHGNPVATAGVKSDDLLAANHPADISSKVLGIVPESWEAITAPMVGTFYRSPTPGEQAFVEVGDSVFPGKVVGLMEVMKLFNELKAEKAGVVTRIDVADGDMVEYGQPLLWIDPS